MQKRASLPPEVLAGLDLFSSADVELLAPMLRTCQLRGLSPGEVLIAAGDRNHALYSVVEGVLSVHLDSTENEPIATLTRGSTVGEISLVDQKPASAFVVAQSEAKLLVIDEEVLWLLADASHAIAYNLLRTLATKIREGNVIIQSDRQLIRKYRFHASVDSLTGLYNRFWLDRMLPRQMQRARRNGEALALMMLDIDHFKRFNDAHGHVAGDYGLQSTAGALRSCMRPTDMIARYGGEEFAVMLPGATVEDARQIGERVRELVASTPVVVADRAELPALTVSVGVAQLGTDDGAQSLIEAADRALYRAKQAGRNRVAM